MKASDLLIRTSFSTQIRDGVARLEPIVPGEPVNKMSRSVRLELEGLLDSLGSDDEVRSVVLISGKSENFIAGADIDEFVVLRNEEEAHGFVQSGQSESNPNLG